MIVGVRKQDVAIAVGSSEEDSVAETSRRAQAQAAAGFSPASCHQPGNAAAGARVRSRGVNLPDLAASVQSEEQGPAAWVACEGIKVLALCCTLVHQRCMPLAEAEADDLGPLAIILAWSVQEVEGIITAIVAYGRWIGTSQVAPASRSTRGPPPSWHSQMLLPSETISVDANSGPGARPCASLMRAKQSQGCSEILPP